MILNKKINQNEIQYKIKLKEYKKTTWKLTNNFRQAKEAINDFEHHNMGSNQASDRRDSSYEAC